MSNTASGRIEGLSNNFNSRFNVNGRSKKFTGSFSQGVMYFKSSTATLTYGDVDDLNGAYEITVAKGNDASFVGEETLTLNLKNEGDVTLTISGKLVDSLSERQTVTGEGKWFEAKDDDE